MDTINDNDGEESAANILRALQMQTENLHRWETEMNISLEEKNRELNEAKRILQDLNSQLDEKCSHASSLEQELAELECQHKENIQQRDSLNNFASCIEREVKSLQDAGINQEDAIMHLKKSSDILETKVESMSHDFNNFEEENLQTVKMLETTLQEKETENQVCFNQHLEVRMKLEQELEYANNELEDKDAELKSTLEELNHDKTLLKEIEVQLVGIQEDFTTAAKDSGALVSELEEQVSKLKREMTVKEVILSELAKDIDATSSKEPFLTEACQDLKQTLTNITEELEGLTKTALDCKSHILHQIEKQKQLEMHLATSENLLSEKETALEHELEEQRKRQEIICSLDAKLKSYQDVGEQFTDIQQKFAAVQISKKYELEQAALRKELTEVKLDRSENILPKIESLQNQLTMLHEENAELKSKIEKEESDKKQLDNDMQRITKLKDCALKEVNEKADELSKMKTEIEKMKKSMALVGQQNTPTKSEALKTKSQMASAKYKHLSSPANKGMTKSYAHHDIYDFPPGPPPKKSADPLTPVSERERRLRQLGKWTPSPSTTPFSNVPRRKADIVRGKRFEGDE